MCVCVKKVTQYTKQPSVNRTSPKSYPLHSFAVGYHVPSLDIGINVHKEATMLLLLLLLLLLVPASSGWRVARSAAAPGPAPLSVIMAQMWAPVFIALVPFADPSPQRAQGLLGASGVEKPFCFFTIEIHTLTHTDARTAQKADCLYPFG